jgi:hypothetical protein
MGLAAVAILDVIEKWSRLFFNDMKDSQAWGSGAP